MSIVMALFGGGAVYAGIEAARFEYRRTRPVPGVRMDAPKAPSTRPRPGLNLGSGFQRNPVPEVEIQHGETVNDYLRRSGDARKAAEPRMPEPPKSYDYHGAVGHTCKTDECGYGL